MSLKSIFRVRRALAPACPARADEADFLGIVFTLSQCVSHHQHAPIIRSSQSKMANFSARVFQIRAIQRVGIREHRRGSCERDAVLYCVRGRLARIPLEHLFSIYEM